MPQLQGTIDARILNDEALHERREQARFAIVQTQLKHEFLERICRCSHRRADGLKPHLIETLKNNALH